MNKFPSMWISKLQDSLKVLLINQPHMSQVEAAYRVSLVRELL